MVRQRIGADDLSNESAETKVPGIRECVRFNRIDALVFEVPGGRVVHWISGSVEKYVSGPTWHWSVRADEFPQMLRPAAPALKHPGEAEPMRDVRAESC